VTRTGRWLERHVPVQPWAVLAAVGSLLVVYAVWHYVREVRTIGLGVGPVVAGALGVSLSLAVVYAAARLRGSDLQSHEGWVVVGTSLGSGLFTSLAYGVTIAVRYFEGRPLVEPAFPLLVVGTIGVLGGVVIGNEYVATRRFAESARESRDAMVFTNDLLRHDVRNALQIVDGHATVLADHDDEQVRESARTISGQSESLERIVTEVESVVEALTEEASTETADLSTVLDDVTESVVAEQAGVTVESDVDPDLPVEGGDALYPVFSNLVGNAIDHTDSPVTVNVSAKRADDSVLARVADDGPGIPEDERDRVFERGVSTDGGGHGLYVADTVVSRLGGDIRVRESDLGGAAFVVEVPVAEGATGPDDGPAEDFGARADRPEE
jgi:signal transduction histidine kinase